MKAGYGMTGFPNGRVREIEKFFSLGQDLLTLTYGMQDI